MNEIEEFTNIENVKINKKCGFVNNGIILVVLLVVFIIIAYLVNVKLLK